MLSGQAAADLDAQLEDLGTECLAQLKITGSVGIEQDQRVHVAVARVEDIPDLEAILLTHLADPAQHIGQLAHRDGPVEAHVVIHLTHGAEGRLAPLPD